MIRQPADLKPLFHNGAVPGQNDFADLIDSFVPRDALSDADLATLREMAAWWRTRPVVPPLAPPVIPPPPPPPPARPPAAPQPAGSVSDIVPADGAWSWLPVNAADGGCWVCTVAVTPFIGRAITGNAIAYVQDGTPFLVQNIKPAWLQPSLAVQFAWRVKDGSGDFWLAVRSSCPLGAGAMIDCTIVYQAPDA